MSKNAEEIMSWLRTIPVSKTPPSADEKAGFDRLEAHARSGAPSVSTEEMLRRLDDWSVPEPPAANAEKHELTSQQRAELNRRIANLPADIAAGRTRSAEDVRAMLDRLNPEMQQAK